MSRRNSLENKRIRRAEREANAERQETKRAAFREVARLFLPQEKEEAVKKERKKRIKEENK